jgi:hypothetical protein
VTVASTRRWRKVVFAAAVLVGVAGLWGAVAAAQTTTDGVTTDGVTTDGADEGVATVESVTTTETSLRRVVVGLLAVATVTAVLTLGYARHTSPRRRAAVAADREAARARRLAAAASVGGFDPPRAPAPERTNGTEQPHDGPSVREPVPAAVRRPRPDPRPQPRRDSDAH